MRLRCLSDFSGSESSWHRDSCLLPGPASWLQSSCALGSVCPAVLGTRKLPLILYPTAGDAAADVPAKVDEKAKDDKGKAAAEAEAAPKPVVKPRRDRKVLHVLKGCAV